MNKFLQAKESVLSRKDKSHEGQIDKHILKLCEVINSKDEYYTTSSCSGRVVLIKESEIKDRDIFLFKSHELVSFSELKEVLEKISKNYTGKVIFKHDPCILHVSCESLGKAQELYDKGKLAGWKRSGIQGSTNNHFIVELNSSERLEFPVMDNGNLLVSDDFLKIIVNDSGKKLRKSWERIKKLESAI